MYRNCNKCCCNRYMASAYPFIKVENNTSLRIYFIVQYYTDSTGFVTRESGIFERNQFQKISYTYRAKNIAFNVVNVSVQTRPVICNKYLGNAANYYFHVVETPTEPICVED